MSFTRRRLARGLCFAVILCFGICMIAGDAVLADTNLVNKQSWVVDGTDDTNANAANISMSVNGHAMGSFSKLMLSYDVGGSGVVAVCTMTEIGEIRMALPPPGEFGGSFFLTSYWDCNAGFVPGMTITDLDIREKGGKKGLLEFKGKISNLVSMASKGFTMTFLPPQTDAFRAELSYSLFATTDFCVDQATHTNSDDFQVARMTSNYISPDVQQNDETRFVKIIRKACFVYGCVTKTKTYCTNVVNQDEFLINDPPRLGGGTVWLAHTQPLPQETPSLLLRLNSPGHSRTRPQGLVTASADPTAQNVSFWADWIDAQASYRNKRRIGKFKYTLEVDSPKQLSCDVQD